MEFIQSIDNSIVDFMQGLHCPIFTDIFRFFTSIGEIGLVWIVLGAVLIIFKRTRKVGIFVLIAIAITALLNNLLLKNLIDRPRPFVSNDLVDTIIKRPTASSLPSGHASAAFAAFFTIFLFDKKKSIPVFFVAFLVTLSRVYFCVHYASDVVVGAVEGIIIAFLVYVIGNAICKSYTIKHYQKQTEKYTLSEGFSYEPIPEKTLKFITGKSYKENEYISPDDLFYLNVLYLDFDGETKVGEIIANRVISKRLLKIFKELYVNKYKIEKIRLIDEYDADDEKSMSDNNSSCFCFRTIADTNTISNHTYGLAIDINPLYNPYIVGDKIMPSNAFEYADREKDFPHKITKKDFCYKQFMKHGFSWGGSWKNEKDYQHFQFSFKKSKK